MLAQQSYRCSDGARAALRDGGGERMRQPHVANAGSSMRQATRLFESRGRPVTADGLMTIETAAIRASRVLAGGLEASLADREQPS